MSQNEKRPAIDCESTTGPIVLPPMILLCRKLAARLTTLGLLLQWHNQRVTAGCSRQTEAKAFCQWLEGVLHE